MCLHVTDIGQGECFSSFGFEVILLSEKEAPGTDTVCLLVDQVLQGREDSGRTVTSNE